MINCEFIDRIIIAAEKQIEGKKEVKVELVKTLIDTLRDVNNHCMSQMYFSDQNKLDN